MAFAKLHEKLGEDFPMIERATIVGAIVQACKGLEMHFQNRDLFVERWIAEKSAKYIGAPAGAGKPRPFKP